MKDVLSNAHRHYVLCVVGLFGGQRVVPETIINSGYILPTLRRLFSPFPHRRGEQNLFVCQGFISV